MSTTREDYDPRIDFDEVNFDIDGRDNGAMLHLTARVISEVYRDVLDDPRRRVEACLGPEDVSWLQSMEKRGQDSCRASRENEL